MLPLRSPRSEGMGSREPLRPEKHCEHTGAALDGSTLCRQRRGCLTPLLLFCGETATEFARNQDTPSWSAGPSRLVGRGSVASCYSDTNTSIHLDKHRGIHISTKFQACLQAFGYRQVRTTWARGPRGASTHHHRVVEVGESSGGHVVQWFCSIRATQSRLTRTTSSASEYL